MAIEALLAAGYALFLALVASCLELAARHSHRRSERMQVSGFHYDEALDLWTCPNNQKLLRAEADYNRRIIYYRAHPHSCNTCAMKSRCTDSDNGRTIEREPESWLESELRRFHRGISLALLLLAAVILTCELFRSPATLERLFLGGMAAAIVVAAIHLSLALRGSPM